MLRFIQTIIFAISFVYLPCKLAAQPILRSKIDSAAQAYLTTHKATGLAIGVLQGDSVQYFCYGTCSQTDTQRIHSQSIFEIASITKTFAATLLARLQVAGRLNYTDSLSQYLPKGTIAPVYLGREIHLYQLAQHTAALPRLGDKLIKRVNLHPDKPYAKYSEKKILSDIHNLKLAYQPGTQYEYSNLGGGLLGYVMSRREKRPFMFLVDSLIKKPLGMQTAEGPAGPETYIGSPTGINENGKPTPHWDFTDVTAATGGIRASIADMGRYLYAEVHPEKIKDSLLRKAIVQSQTYQRFSVSENMKIALGWHMSPFNGRALFWHNGGTGGFRSFMGYLPGDKGIVVLANSPEILDDLSVSILQWMSAK